MNIGSPLFTAIALAAGALWVILLLLPGLRRRPPGCEEPTPPDEIKEESKKE